MRVYNEKEFGDAIRREEDYIELDGKLASHVKKLIKLNAVLWAFCLAALSVSIIAVIQMPVTAGMSGIVSTVSGTAAAAAVLGVDTAVAAVSIAIAGGGITTLYKLRKYCLKCKRNGKIIIYLKG